MRIHVDLPSELVVGAGRVARESGLDRDRVLALALREYLERHDPASITRALDRVYANTSSQLDPGIERAQSEVLASDDWYNPEDQRA